MAGDKPWWRDWRAMPPSRRDPNVPLSSGRVLAIRLALVVQVIVGIGLLFVDWWVALFFLVFPIIQMGLLPELHRNQVLRRRTRA